MKKIIFNPQKDQINDIINSQPDLIYVGIKQYAQNKAVAMFKPHSINCHRIVMRCRLPKSKWMNHQRDMV